MKKGSNIKTYKNKKGKINRKNAHSRSPIKPSGDIPVKKPKGK